MARSRESGLEVTVEAAPLITIDEARKHLRMRHEDDDELINRLIKAATEFHENQIGRQLMKATFRWNLCGFSKELLLPRPPAQSVTQIDYVDTAGDTQTLSSSLYQTDFTAEPARVWPAWGEVWPTTRQQLKAVLVTYIAGYGTDPKLVPQEDASVVLALVERTYRHSSGLSDKPQRTVAMAVNAMATSRRVFS